MTLDQSALDYLWDFQDPAASEEAFRRALEDPAYDDVARAELTTQLGRAIGLQGRFEEADALLDGISAEQDPTIGVRVLLERGRLLNSAKHAAMAVPLFEQAAELGEHLDSPRAQRWCVALHGNLGWHLLEAGEAHRALVEFQLAEQWAERLGTPDQAEWAREGIAACRAAGA
jgi:hypothetical protein